MKKIYFVLCALAFGATACTNDDRQAENDMMTIPNIILDTDLGNSTDDVFAMQALFAGQAKSQCKVVGVMQSRKMEKAKDLLDRFMHFYKADNVPVGLVEGEEQFFEIVPYYQLADSVWEDGAPLFAPTGISLADRLPAWKLYRRLLSEADDNSITIVCVGMLTNLGQLIESEGDEYSPLSGKELIRRKVKSLELMGCCFNPVPLRYQEVGESCRILEVEYNISGDVPLAKKVIGQWPGLIHVLPLEEGMRFPSIHDMVLEQYAWQKDSPIYQVYSHYDEWATGDVGQYLWDVLTLLHPILGETCFKCSVAGYVTIDDVGRTTFTPAGSGNAHIISFNSDATRQMWDILNEIALFHP